MGRMYVAVAPRQFSARHAGYTWLREAGQLKHPSLFARYRFEDV
jgi:hypothetical protein